ncbi:cell division ATP-binding protein FtsE [Candidatus Uhrbacteria bacterium CG10_big_fil_rev_8_21_14_0_10_48_11]|uniref:Cell division ATP-binding protein FtsE n=1 Tax=Candidatus Uhrbacteria bacterium CG10_big_fil_rev_8_21_14_0_10_48_11 TaxID=1975037 RepID=A0A2M8LEL8_9BACT|nr:MAG: cell division ATP-binding protein FtsE [Candidatus Uhrbacteria bacterium CG10_big_fil_rev_8_21_14_0_10_48_11]
MIQLKGVTKSYDGKITALQGVSFSIKPGELVSIVGRSGAGKSTVVRLLLAEERASKGTINVGGWDITAISHRDVPQFRRQIGVVFQDFKLLPRKTVFENVAFALEVSGEPTKIIREVVPQVLNLVGLSNRLHQYPEQLSGGEQQRASIARALIHRPKLLLADEPTGNLDSINTAEIIDLLKKINDLGTTVVLVTHNRDVVNTLRRRVITLDKGAVISDQAVGRYVL